MTVERTVGIAAAPAAVFSVVADPSTHPRWRPSALEFRALDGRPLRVGSRLVETVRFLGRRYRTTYEVTELEAPRVFAVRTVDGPVALTLRCRLDPARGGTRVRFSLTTGASPVLSGVLSLYLQDEARRLKRLVESEAAAGRAVCGWLGVPRGRGPRRLGSG